MISKEEFDSQRGETHEPDFAESDVLFPLDPVEPTPAATGTVDGGGGGKPEAPPSQPSPTATGDTAAMTSRRQEGGGARSRRTPSPNKAPKKKPLGKVEQRARFYALPEKQPSPAKVSGHFILKPISVSVPLVLFTHS